MQAGQPLAWGAVHVNKVAHHNGQPVRFQQRGPDLTRPGLRAMEARVEMAVGQETNQTAVVTVEIIGEDSSRPQMFFEVGGWLVCGHL